MALRHHLTAYAAAATILSFAAHPAAAALTMKECGAKYQAAKTANTLNGMDWKTFRATQCGATPAAVPATAAAAPAPVVAPTAAPVALGAAAKPAPVAAAAPPVLDSTAEKHAAKTTVPPMANPVFPGAVDPKYASLSSGKARMKTCDDQYHANKATGGNAGLKWIQKGGGYYSVCLKHLKAA